MRISEFGIIRIETKKLTIKFLVELSYPIIGIVIIVRAYGFLKNRKLSCYDTLLRLYWASTKANAPTRSNFEIFSMFKI